ncbi:VOC family protein [Bordetella sp. LUAb4]|uniref:VOC family protein n=1 Tax=Bordetella sp. LUAb4 TaxID=2843195 RepID=UPI001E571D61|nr:VOC family protein [Bordetella sp. LUAb4]
MSLPSVTGLDHYIIRVNDLVATTERYKKLGFSLAPQGRHHSGTRNQTLILDSNYLELLYFPPEQRATSRFKHFPDEYEGPVAVALQTTDSAAVQRELATVGIHAEAPLSGGRPVHLPQGSEDAAWLNLNFPEGVFGIPDYFTCGHLTRHLVFRPEWQEHENTARRIEALVAVHPDPASLREQYQKAFGAISIGRADSDGWLLQRGSLRLRFLTPTAFSARYAGIQPPASQSKGWLAGSVIGVRDIDTTRKVLARNGVPTRAGANGEIVVDPAHAAGTLQVFVQELWS